ncbi:alpha-galactosidase [Falsihalocynthiibacter arcticus]|uniref:alpha-galactosidase n=1 Tax=Falsihalocynthiibacter arcticus TaxID=1579316 RepID=A0A126UWZ0_9RHOB|nr:alpha-galactosidase [Falsihalocynthiibacter arcticus]AML50387.1 alpha-galactosidase [Falsihalocynthiibacter arcticus]
MTSTWRLDSPTQTLVLASEGQLPSVIYWGALLPSSEDLSALYAMSKLDVTGGMLDTVPPLTICPVAGDSFPGHAGLSLRDAQGKRLLLDFAQVDVSQVASLLKINARDAISGVTYTASFAADSGTGVITARAAIASEHPVIIEHFSAPVLPAPQQANEMIDFAGKWIGEFQAVTTPWQAGIRARNTPTGRSGHEQFPGLYLPETGAKNTHGSVYALHYGWAGGNCMIAEELPDGRRQVQFGPATGSITTAVTSFETAPLYLAYSNAGMNGCAISFQRHVRDRIITWPRRNRPVHYNCWEAIYFDHDLATLSEIATRAAALGAERFVLDDGWFGKRDDDTSSLGDWVLDRRKWPDGLTPLITHVKSLGMGFGLWFEPEMVNPDSDLYRSHPEWALGRAEQILGRQQMVLDMARADVRGYLYDLIADVLVHHEIEYIKWDHNRVLPANDVAQTEGVYALMDRLRANFPDVEIESCSSGGGRMDYGILERTQRVWLSDSNDAIERQHIQHNAALFLPASVTGSHVGPRHCHTSGRTLNMSLRAWTAAQRHLGFEMDPRELSDAETETLTTVTHWWKSNRDWMLEGDIHRLDAPDPEITAEIQIARDGQDFVCFIAKTANFKQVLPRPIRLTGLVPNATYEVSLINAADPSSASPPSRGDCALNAGDVTLSGAALMQLGLTLPCSFPETIFVVQGKCLDLIKL